MTSTSSVKKDTASPTPVRFYEELCAPFDHEPTSEILKIISNDVVGEGIVACRTFQPGEIVFKFHGRVLSEQTLYTLQQAPGVYVEDPIVMGKVLHACDPNMVCDVDTLTFTAAKPIAVGEYLTMDYDSTEDVLFRNFTCACGAAACRGQIRGRLG